MSCVLVTPYRAHLYILYYTISVLKMKTYSKFKRLCTINKNPLQTSSIKNKTTLVPENEKDWMTYTIIAGYKETDDQLKWVFHIFYSYLILSLPKVHSNFGKKSFCFQGTSIWNSLPTIIKSKESFFKSVNHIYLNLFIPHPSTFLSFYIRISFSSSYSASGFPN